jgi:hypothetical protein
VGRVIGLNHDYGREMSYQKGYSQVEVRIVGQAERVEGEKLEDSDPLARRSEAML